MDLLLGNRADAFGSAGDGFLIKNANIGLNLPFGNGIDLTVGLFDSIVGYETEASASNPNVSRSYGYGLGPLTHTGALASTSLTDGLNFSFGLANSFGSTLGTTASDVGDNNFTYMVGVEATVPDNLGFLAGSTVYVGYVDGAASGSSNDDEDSHLYVGASVASPIEGVSLGVAYDDRTKHGAASDSDAVALYAVWDVSDGVSLAGRYDTIDSDGDSSAMWTATLGYSIWDNVLTRLEYNIETGHKERGDSAGFALNLYYQF